MPFQNEHAARQADPSRYERFRRSPMKGAEGVDAVWGILPSGKVEIQSLRFDAERWSPSEARTWLERNDFKTTVEEARRKTVDDIVAGLASAASAATEVYAAGDESERAIAQRVAKFAHDIHGEIAVIKARRAG